VALPEKDMETGYVSNQRCILFCFAICTNVLMFLNAFV